MMDNLARRKVSLLSAISNILETSSLSVAVGLQFCGRLGFAASQLGARIGSAPMWHLGHSASAGGLLMARSDVLKAFLPWQIAVITQPPRQIVLRHGVGTQWRARLMGVTTSEECLSQAKAECSKFETFGSGTQKMLLDLIGEHS